MLADRNGRGDVFGHVDHQPGRGAAGEPVGDPSPAGPPEVGPGRVGHHSVAESVNRALPREVDAVVDALGNQATDPPQRVTVAGPGGAGDGGADDLRRAAPGTAPGPKFAGRLRQPGPYRGGCRYPAVLRDSPAEDQHDQAPDRYRRSPAALVPLLRPGQGSL